LQDEDEDEEGTVIAASMLQNASGTNDWISSYRSTQKPSVGV
jgi:hypothetical protein